MPDTIDSFMRDARASGADFDSMMAPKKTRAPSTIREVKKLNWFQKNVLCMKIDIHKAQFRAHCERQDIAHNQQLILHHVTGGKGRPPKAQSYPDYKHWNTAQYNWIEIEQQLYGTTVPCFPQPPQNDEDEIEEEDDDEFEEGDDGEESGGDGSEDSFNYDDDE